MIHGQEKRLNLSLLEVEEELHQLLIQRGTHIQLIGQLVIQGLISVFREHQKVILDTIGAICQESICPGILINNSIHRN